MPSKKSNVAAVVEKAARPLAEEMGLSLWDVEFVKEGASYYLRLYIDKESGVGIDDCEAFHRRIDPIIDELDPIEQSYFLEVSSPGLNRVLKRPEHFQAMRGKTIRVRLYQPDETGAREITGVLKAFADGVITIGQDGGEKNIRLKDTVSVKLYDDDFIEGIEV